MSNGTLYAIRTAILTSALLFIIRWLPILRMKSANDLIEPLLPTIRHCPTPERSDLRFEGQEQGEVHASAADSSYHQAYQSCSSTPYWQRSSVHPNVQLP